jgi:uncharacterized membrane protein YphA (DoxX/SURF4 family)
MSTRAPAAVLIEKIGFRSPEIVAPFVACFEISCGTLLVLGLLTRLATIPLIVVMLTAIAVTKIPLASDQGFWKMAHEARTDWAMLLGLIFLLIVGAGGASVDALWSNSGQGERRALSSHTSTFARSLSNVDIDVPD